MFMNVIFLNVSRALQQNIMSAKAEILDPWKTR